MNGTGKYTGNRKSDPFFIIVPFRHHKTLRHSG